MNNENPSELCLGFLFLSAFNERLLLKS